MSLRFLYLIFWQMLGLVVLMGRASATKDSRARTGSGLRVMVGLRNLAIGALHLASRRDITEATRWATRNMYPTFQILGLTQ